MTTPKTIYTKPTVAPTKLPHPPNVQTYISKPSTSGKTPPVPIGILWKTSPPKPPPQQKEVRKSLVNPNLKILFKRYHHWIYHHQIQEKQ